ncbi:oxidoreductase [Actinopolymorpha pittospori]|uniref:NAD(P)-dependent dehydrogenase (Short-subunit alcohol dehydrogenase family) n=1 Tax=Actinopolymorpha pittospori TaxID=648752 RepID=A0A927N546_9ACTN|nr:oxidoreductase [Actinopolymorpha pittospori]MBE1609132.1 NAD(P)-dependent dehydrogenase (short-subunit alcohol dehydrogenase family) [Actinopolymorpha pittospori]
MKTWFITGCSSGFGRHLAEEVLARGHQVVVTARNVNRCTPLVEGVGSRALVLPLDVTDHAQAGTAVAAAHEAFGGIDVLVNNAGIGYFGAVEESAEAEVRRMFEINVFGLCHLTRAVLPGMRARRTGTIVNFSTIGGLRSFPCLGYYNATKFAVEGLSEALWQEVEPLGLRVLIVEPGPFRTDWAGRSAEQTPPTDEIADYANTAGTQRAALRTNAGREPGDPRRAAAAIASTVEARNPPHRLLLGGTAYEMAMHKLDELRAEFTNWEPLTRSADFPVDDQSLIHL